MTGGTTSVGALARRFPFRIGFTMLLVLVEAGAELLFPLAIGLAIDGLIRGDTAGLVLLGALGAGSLIVGSARRCYDTRAYGAIYAVVAAELATAEHARGTPVSAIAARTTLLGELVEFFENSMPMVISAAIGIVGTLAILAGIDVRVFVASLGLLAVVVVVYAATASTNLRLTKGANDEFELQVAVLETRNACAARRHFGNIVGWNRRLSDLETLNFFVIYLGALALPVYSPIVVVGAPDPRYGVVFAAVMYVFQYIEAVLGLPLFLQQVVRLHEITRRL